MTDFIGSFDLIKILFRIRCPSVHIWDWTDNPYPSVYIWIELCPKTKAPIRFFFTFQYFCCIRQRFLEIVVFTFLVNTKTTISNKRSRKKKKKTQNNVSSYDMTIIRILEVRIKIRWGRIDRVCGLKIFEPTIHQLP